jgi:hypothetical protein
MQGSALIRFVTDRSLVFKGFRIRFQVHSCGGRITEETEIHSPIHPDRYHHNTNCTWIIVAPVGRAVEIKYYFIYKIFDLSKKHFDLSVQNFYR